eukprot:NODE_1705_length_762_cov_118.714961_g1656_i0.p1 GENE.NODE_1705_length_762_cov_118.714961_g1656_i0~~NODE_1705_length_762_cov_118.714961_g1656_i0.p1  ORF type:complete len:177 (+),score=29.79 NODE_1705_length_762_cov_118.714961_g1656_i0:189-719(+)
MSHSRSRSVSPSPTAPQPKVLKISRDEEEKIVDRLYSKSVEQHAMRLEKRKREIYREEDPVKIPEAKIQEKVTKMMDFEMENRKRKHQSLLTKYYPDAPTVKRASEEVQESVSRLYGNAAAKEKKLQQLEEKYQFKPKPTGKSKTKDEQADIIARLSKPKRTDWSGHKYYGATHGT